METSQDKVIMYEDFRDVVFASLISWKRLFNSSSVFPLVYNFYKDRPEKLDSIKNYKEVFKMYLDCVNSMDDLDLNPPKFVQLDDNDIFWIIKLYSFNKFQDVTKDLFVIHDPGFLEDIAQNIEIKEAISSKLNVLSDDASLIVKYGAAAVRLASKIHFMFVHNSADIDRLIIALAYIEFITNRIEGYLVEDVPEEYLYEEISNIYNRVKDVLEYRHVQTISA